MDDLGRYIATAIVAGRQQHQHRPAVGVVTDLAAGVLPLRFREGADPRSKVPSTGGGYNIPGARAIVVPVAGDPQRALIIGMGGLIAS